MKEINKLLNGLNSFDTLSTALELIKNKQLYIRNLIKIKLENDMLDNSVMSKKGIGRETYKNYIWLPVVINNNTYWVTMFANDVDTTSGNIHTRIGHIQFWKDISTVGCGSPNEIIEPKEKEYTFVKIYYPSVDDSKKEGIFRKAQLSNYTIDTIRSIKDVNDLVNGFYDFLFANEFPEEKKQRNYEKKYDFLKKDNIYVCKECGYCFDVDNNVCPVCETSKEIKN